ncbi:hypothetical protein E2C01_016498 [Portunus trituberculatus]|uniref:Uncharacterized protein n=1 Tax=Portunus trituberculatus TaxID=210409 RepID=A0A5B7DQV7_PORTR|nr:hypothetical protein [Portunus trituberculatus]
MLTYFCLSFSLTLRVVRQMSDSTPAVAVKNARECRLLIVTPFEWAAAASDEAWMGVRDLIKG